MRNEKLYSTEEVMDVDEKNAYVRGFSPINNKNKRHEIEQNWIRTV